MKAIGLTHVFTFFKSLGGVESVLRRHWQNDAASGIHSQVFALFEPRTSSPERVIGLGLTWRDSIHSARRKFRHLCSDAGRDVIVYHNAWGVPFFADLDGAERRIVLLHSDLPTLEQIIQSQFGLTDGVLCVSEPLQTAVRDMDPRLAPDRVVVIPYPIGSGPTIEARQPLQNRAIRVGFAGRIVREQKRIDRLPLLLQRLDALGVPYEFEILGEGPDLPWLKKQLSAKRNVVLHGRKEGADYWRVLGSWDAILFVSDYEGLPISLIEALSVGVLPIYPRIGSGGDGYAAAVREDLLYEASDLDSVAGLMNRIAKSSSDEIEAMRHRCRVIARPHQGDAYERAFADFIRKICEAPRISAAKFGPRAMVWSDYLPFGVLRRMFYRGLFQCTPRAQVK